MNTRLIVLELVLRELGIESKIDTLQDRIRLQKAIYLTQEAGLSLGYRYSWYFRGPYSTGLTRDYYYLQIASGDDSEAAHQRNLRQHVKSSLRKIKPIMSVPTDVSLDSSAWLELVSSLHYLISGDENNDRKKARKKLRKLKPGLSEFIKPAERELSQIGLLSTVAD